MSARLKAFLTHLTGSLLVLSILLYLIIFQWYPQPFFSSDGGWEGIRLIAGIDLILGPALTLLVYSPKKSKRKLAFDMSVILAFQVVALSIGSYIVHDQRTQLVVFADDHFESLSGPLVKETNIAPEVWRTLRKGNTTAMAFVVMPEDPKERAKFIMRTVMSGKPLSERADKYQPLTRENRALIMKKGYDLASLVSHLPKEKKLLDSFLSKVHGQIEDYVYIPLVSRYDEATLVMRKSDGEIVGSLSISPTRAMNEMAKLKRSGSETNAS